MATPAAGAVTSYELTAGIRLNIDEMIYLISPTDLPMTLGVDSDGTMVVRHRLRRPDHRSTGSTRSC